MSDDVTTEAKTVFKEVVDAVHAANNKFKDQAKDEPDDKFLNRLLEDVSEMPDDDYKTLSEDAQAWFKEAAELANVNKAAPLPPGFTSTFEAPAGKPTIKKGVKKGAADKADKADKPTASTPPAETKTRGRAKQEGPTIGEIVRRAVIENRDIKLAALETKLAEHGFTVVKKSTIFSFQRGSLDTLKVAEAMGRFSWS